MTDLANRGYTLERISEQFGNLHISTISKIVKRVRQHDEKQKKTDYRKR